MSPDVSCRRRLAIVKMPEHEYESHNFFPGWKADRDYGEIPKGSELVAISLHAFWNEGYVGLRFQHESFPLSQPGCHLPWRVFTFPDGEPDAIISGSASVPQGSL